ncbi:MAG: hypothetical protein JW763_04345 [candidate division Zixibacteria bacterium]|nr:hypothetical protein [candidate division Zixibacteria bacterium]
MKRYPSILITLALSMLALAGFYGCSDDSPTDAELSSGIDAFNAVVEYFPVQEGVSADFTITDNVNSSEGHQRICIGKSVRVNGRQVYQWLFTNLDYPSLVDTGYLYGENNALYYFELGDSQAERILEAPFIQGRSWERYDVDITAEDEEETYTYALDSNLTGYNGKEQVDDPQDDYIEYNESAPALTTPVTGSNELKIRAVEEALETESGLEFDDCLRVENLDGGYVNRYWYAAGVGLVRYALRISEKYPEGEIVGEVTSSSPSL